MKSICRIEISYFRDAVTIFDFRFVLWDRDAIVRARFYEIRIRSGSITLSSDRGIHDLQLLASWPVGAATAAAISCNGVTSGERTARPPRHVYRTWLS